MLTPTQRETLVEAIRDQFACDWNGYHAIAHWERVCQNGIEIARHTRGADPEVVELFALFHDAGRVNEDEDPDHGPRGADLARRLRGYYFDCSRSQLEQLCFASQFHSDGLTEGDPTVRACWDADRLDLPRVGIIPDPELLCTEFGRHMAEARHDSIRGRALRRTEIRDAAGQPGLLYHGTAHQGTLDPQKTSEGGVHFGTYDQARMRALGSGKVLVPAYLIVTNPKSARDEGGDWKDKIRRARKDGHDAITYLNRWESVSSERIDELQKSGMVNKLDGLSDREFMRHVPEAQMSVIVFESDQIIQLPSVMPPPRRAPAVAVAQPDPGSPRFG